MQAVPEATGALSLSWMNDVYAEIWSEHFKDPLDDMPSRDHDIRQVLRQVFLGGPWNEVYDLVEFLINSGSHQNLASFVANVARILKEEHAGFRLINGQFVEITDETEIAAIKEGFRITNTERFHAAREHLTAALKLLSDRKNPDERNSIKESISAVEATVRILAGKPRVTLGDGIDLLQARAPIHGALTAALKSLYGFTSDAEGIRHALTEAPNIDAADAKFMLVVCSAFVVYLIQKVMGTL